MPIWMLQACQFNLLLTFTVRHYNLTCGKCIYITVVYPLLTL